MGLVECRSGQVCEENNGCGYMRIPLNSFPTLFMGQGELVGHSGSTGSVAFYFPDKGCF